MNSHKLAERLNDRYTTKIFKGLIRDKNCGDGLTKDDEILEELRRIRELLATKPAPPAPAPKGLWNEFMDFLSKYKVLGLAVAFILAIYLGQLIQALVNDLIMPILNYVFPGASWKDIHVGKFMVGDFIGAVITFVIVAFVIFLLVKTSKRWGLE